MVCLPIQPIFTVIQSLNRHVHHGAQLTVNLCYAYKGLFRLLFV